MADEIKYEYKTVQTVRGTDNLVISKMQKEDWELVEQAQGRLRSTLTFRRPKKPQPWLLIGAVAAVLVILAIVIGVGTALSDGGGKKDGAWQADDRCEREAFVCDDSDCGRVGCQRGDHASERPGVRGAAEGGLMRRGELGLRDQTQGPDGRVRRLDRQYGAPR